MFRYSSTALLQRCRFVNSSLLMRNSNNVISKPTFTPMMMMNIKNYSTATATSATATSEVKVPTQLIQELRKKTSAPVSDCKKALQSSNNDMDGAIQWLLEKGKATASKLSNRVAVEGVISVVVTDNKAVIVEMNSETDFVSRGDSFRQLIDQISRAVLNSSVLTNQLKNIETSAITNQTLPADKNQTISESIVAAIAKLRENLQLRRIHGICSGDASNVVLAGYAHDLNGTKQFGRLGSLVELEFDATRPPTDKAALNKFANDIAVHIVGVGATYVSIADVPKEVLDEAIKNKRHPNSLYDEVVLLEQKFISSEDGESVKQALDRISKQLDTTIKIKSFTRYVVGEGMEKKKEDYGAEVLEKLNQAKK